MSYVKCLGYIGVGSDDLDAWRQFGTEVLGLQVGEGPANPETEALYLRMDGRAYRIAIEKGENGALHYLGFDVATRQQLSELGIELRSMGLEVTEESAEACAHRRVAAMLSTNDPAGNRIEFFVGHEEATAPFVSPTGAQFVIGDMGIGHAFVTVPSIEDFMSFYIGNLGFRLSDTIELAAGITAYFLHCNARHHSIGGLVIPDVSPGLLHIMLQVQSIDSVGRAYDKVKADGISIAATLGKHTNDHMISFYCETPSGFMVEYGIEGRLIDDETWVVGHYTSASYWGHERKAAYGAG
jgi:2,3-dihydroxybiphenyl 1,2-dioxygenase